MLDDAARSFALRRKRRANPTALILSAVLMVRYLSEKEAAGRIENAVRAVFTRGEVRSGDLGGTATTKQFVGAVLAEMH